MQAANTRKACMRSKYPSMGSEAQIVWLLYGRGRPLRRHGTVTRHSVLALHFAPKPLPSPIGPELHECDSFRESRRSACAEIYLGSRCVLVCERSLPLLCFCLLRRAAFACSASTLVDLSKQSHIARKSRSSYIIVWC